MYQPSKVHYTTVTRDIGCPHRGERESPVVVVDVRCRQSPIATVRPTFPRIEFGLTVATGGRGPRQK
ncbi:hypothetical protein AFLA_006701 [Aspergillus flavus NRRL3357]|nr:hypothetical protein AFLA_006701 [Aspergillus flavus NRRL3357]